MAHSRPKKIHTPAIRPATSKKKKRVAKSKFDQFYTKRDTARGFYGMFLEDFGTCDYRMIEPSAGDGAFFELLPPGSLGFDIDPKFPGIAREDFLKIEMPTDRLNAVIGNPPFGSNAALAVRFFNHAARQADVIAMIFPRSFRKASIENRLNRDFHLFREEPVASDAFLHDGKTFKVSAVFQVWVRLPFKRQLRNVETTHPDFEFTEPSRANFVIQRVGARAGRVHRDFKASPNSHYFIRGRVKGIMDRLDFVTAAADATANPSLAKSEIVALYIRRKTGVPGPGPVQTGHRLCRHPRLYAAATCAPSLSNRVHSGPRGSRKLVSSTALSTPRNVAALAYVTQTSSCAPARW